MCHSAGSSKSFTEQAEQERQAAVIRAEGEGEAATIISKALEKAGEGLVQIRRIEASRDIAATLVSIFPQHVDNCTLSFVVQQAKGRNVTYLPSGSNGLLLNVRLSFSDTYAVFDSPLQVPA